MNADAPDRGAARWAFLAAASRLLAESLDTERTLEAVASMLVPAWADVCCLGLLNAGGRLELTGVACANPAERVLVEASFADHAAVRRAGELPDRVLRTGRAVVAPEYRDPAPEGPHDRPGVRTLRDYGARSLIIAPLRIRGDVLGLMFAVMTTHSDRRFEAGDAELVQDAADRAAQAIDNARLYRAEQDARALAEQAVLAARAAEERFRAAFEHAPNGMALLVAEPGGPLRYAEVNPALCRIVGCEREQLAGRPADDLVAPRDDGEQERRIVRPDGQERWIQVHAAPLNTKHPDGGHAYVAQVQDVTDRRRFERELEHLASHDPLTGLLNRRRFQEELERALAHVRRHGEPACVVTLDLDNFKHVNDTYGHAAGDELLRASARALMERVRATDAVGRLGGDEFGIVLAHTGPEEASAVAESLLDAFRARVGVDVGGRLVRVTASAGVRALDGGTETAGELLGEADMAMYDAKERGRDRLSVVGEHEVRPERVRSRMRWAERIRDALEHDGFVLFEQPIVRLQDGTVDRAELLLRMLDGGGDPVPPADFLPVAERYGHIRAIDRWVVRRAIELLAARRAAGSSIGAGVNLSGDSISDASVIDYILAEIANAGIDPGCLTFEVTETAAIGNLDRARRLARQLSELGCGFALDDFGAGFGSFAYLKHLPLDLIKIDGDFIRTLPSSPQDQVTVRAIVDVARGHGKQTVAEFVEDGATLELLRRLGVDRAQGYHVGRPRPALVLPRF